MTRSPIQLALACLTTTSLVATIAAWALGNHDAFRWMLLATIGFAAFLMAWWRA